MAQSSYIRFVTDMRCLWGRWILTRL